MPLALIAAPSPLLPKSREAQWGLGLAVAALLALALVLLSRLPRRLRARRHPSITAFQLEELMQGPHPLVVDLRPPEAVRREGHIKGSLLLPLDRLEAQVPSILKQALLPVPRPIILVDEHDAGAHAAADVLKAHGADWYYVLMDGFHGWRKGRYPVVK